MTQHPAGHRTTASPATAPDGDAPILALQDVAVHFRARGGRLFRPNTVAALDGVDFSVRRGETVGVVGESGSGKSTLASVLVGLQLPTTGTVRFRGEPVRRLDGRLRREFGRTVAVVFQDPSTALNPRMTIEDILLDPLLVHRIGDDASRRRRVRELLDLVGLPQSAAEVTPSNVSGGQRQRVAIARGLALDPDLLIADEPTSALDVSVRAQVLNLLGDLKRQLGLGMVFISHDIQTVRYVSDRICVIHHGKIVEEGNAAEVFDRPRDAYTRTLLGAAPSLLHP